ncbi:MAG: hypothetical protein IAF38_09040 [Bacteroidia bacterium]|nr:hypothetical protein [Bacteroidia bacterium]
MLRYFPLFFSLFFFLNVQAQDSTAKKKPKTLAEKFSDTAAAEILPPALGDIFKPSIGIGTGMFSFYGDVYSKNYQAPWTSRVAYDLSISQPLSKSFRLNFYILFGKLGANERIDDKRFVNFESQIRLGGLNVMYTFDHFFSDKLKIRPWVSLGFEGFEFLSKTDTYDRFGNKYYYWSDGSIKNIDENASNAQNAVELVRDYKYESDIRESNLDGFGKYPERSWSIPIGGGALMKIGERFEFKIGATFHYAFTDYIDGISQKSVGDRVGNKRKDCFVMTSFSLHYDLVTKSKLDTLPKDHFDFVDFVALDKEDEDGDNVRDFEDICHGTPAGVKVTKDGCPVDTDEDWIPDYRDDEEGTPKGVLANGKGVGYTDEMAAKWYELYYDSTGSTAQVIALGNSAAGEQNQALINGKKTDSEKTFTVEMGVFGKSVPDEVMLFLLSIGDVKSTTDGDNTIYTAGNYSDIKTAIKRKEEFEKEGLKNLKIGSFQNDNYQVLSEKEVVEEVNISNGIVIKPKNPDDTANHNHNINFRVQLGAYKNKISKSVFGKDASKILEIPTDDGYFRYVSIAYPTLHDAAVRRADFILDGYPDAFITAYKDGKRIPLKEAGATYENKKDEKENLDEKTTTSSVDKNLVSFTIQLSVIRKAVNPDFENQIKDLKDVQKQTTVTGMYRYTAGKFANYNDAVKFKNQLVAEGYAEAFVIGSFKDEFISAQEALELLK